MKIVQIMASNGEGGLEKHFIELCNGLADQGQQVFALCLPQYKDRLSPRVNFVSSDLTGSRINPIAILKLLAALRKINPDIIHAQANKAAQMVAPCLSRLNAKSVVTIHNKKNNLKFLSNFDLCVGVSKGVIENFPNPEQGLVIYNGITVPSASSTAPQPPFPKLDETRKTLLSIGRLVPAKGFDILINAAKQVDANFLIAGDGPDRTELETLVKSYGLEDKVFLLGHRDDIPELIDYSDLVVISSRKEGFSYVFAESLLLRTPILSTDVPIPNEVLPSRLIANTNSEDLAEKLNTTLLKLDELDEFEAIFDYATTHLTFEMQLKKTIQAYEGLLPC